MRIHVPAWAKRRPTKGLAVIITTAVAAVVLLGGGGYALFFAGSPQSSDSDSVNLQKGLVGYWPFNGNAKDATPYANDGTVSDATLTTDRFGNTDSAYSFNGTDSSITIPDSSNLRLNGNFTISFWYQDNGATGTYPGLVSQGTSHITPGQGWAIFYNSATGGLEYKRDNITYGKDGYVNSSPHLYTITYDSSTLYMYVDGAQITSGAPSYATDTSTTGLNIGGGTSYAKGTMDDLRIYNRALNTNEITALYNGAGSDTHVGNLQSGLVGEWKFDGSLKDSTPYGDNCTIPYSTLSYGTDRNGRASSSLYTVDSFSEDRYADCGQPANILFGQNFTVSAWVNSTQFNGGGNGIFAYGPGNFLFDGSGHLEAVIDDTGGGNTAFTTSQTYTVNQWYFVTLAYDGATVKMYVNGSQVYSQSFTTYQAATAPNNEIFVGNWSSPSSTRNFIGYLDDVRVYDRTLPAGDVQQLYDSYDSQINLGGSGSANSSNSVNLSKGLVGYWPFTGNAKDATPYGDNGTVNGATLTTDRFGRPNNAYSFDGTGSNITVPYNSVFKLNGAFTISFWYQDSGATSSWPVIVGQGALGATSGQGWEAYYSTQTGNLDFRRDNVIYAAAGTVNSTPHSYTIRYDGTQLSIYVDGVQSTYGGCVYVTNTSTAGLNIGSASNNYAKGVLDDLRIYNRALSVAEIQALYNLNN